MCFVFKHFCQIFNPVVLTFKSSVTTNPASFSTCRPTTLSFRCSPAGCPPVTPLYSAAGNARSCSDLDIRFQLKSHSGGGLVHVPLCRGCRAEPGLLEADVQTVGLESIHKIKNALEKQLIVETFIVLQHILNY